MGICYEIPNSDADYSRQFVVESVSEAEAVKHHEIPNFGEVHQRNFARIVTEKRAESINQTLFRVTVVYEDPTIDFGAGI